ncbi:amidase [Allosediminivita pacifica]|uniref:Asp-tRNA(Asn)/Glu-tRNA(Gln) amidotransferase A subunit family amidase n=1 Tax=Allosediminivita pacifica TaxID=1267769 RepID=A0A2T6AUL3_9RHOB|nr:amidase family protein [Allosediminivita pacifica]PTX47503.1 Asp-tRNA(Asn)/Glu-tRNA(Gln) amidotransferase A subunit family amidase [Allosediminivita pacifica]GGB14679.1 amidase [Allosediminivita pacifica]
MAQTIPTDPADLGAAPARRLIARKALSASELAEACIARVETVDHAVNALVARDFDGLRRGAKAADDAVASGDELGPLHGLPFGVKDMIDVAGLPTTFGSELFRDNIATKDDAIVAAMRAAGALPMGKTNNPEWSAGGNTRNRVYGATANPHDLTRSCAGSSGGSAAGLSAGYFPLATGSDTGGSLRNPAAFCGVVGYRPSPGVVPGNTRGIGYFPLSTSGPMGRTVEDTALMLLVLARPDMRDPYTAVVDGRTAWDPARFARLPRRDLSALRVAFTEDYGFAPTEGIVRDHFRRIVPQLAPLFASGEEGTPDCSDADRIFSVLRGILFVGQHGKHLDDHPEQVGPNVTENVHEGRSFSPDDIAEALSMQGAFHQRWQTWFETHDFVISPAVTISPRDWHELYPTEIDGVATKSYYHWLAMAYASTIAGHPSITIPCGTDANGMPFGLQIVGRRYDDLGVLAVAAELEAVIAGISDLAPRGPDIAALKAAGPLSEAEGFLSL